MRARVRHAAGLLVVLLLGGGCTIVHRTSGRPLPDTASSLAIGHTTKAQALAAEEIAHTAGVCETLAAGVWITVRRTPGSGDGAIDEQYSVYDRLQVGAHTL